MSLLSLFVQCQKINMTYWSEYDENKTKARWRSKKKISFPWNVKLQLQETCALTPNMEEDKVATAIYHLDQQVQNLLTINSAS